MVSERWGTTLSHSALDTDPGTNPSTEVQELPPLNIIKVEEGALSPVQVSSSSSPDEAMAGPSNFLSQDDFKAHQDLLKHVTSNLGLEVEELREILHNLIDILNTAASAKVTLPINETVMGPVKALWQTSSLAPTSKRAEKKYYIQAEVFNCLFSHLLPKSLVVSMANERDRQVLPQNERTQKKKETFLEERFVPQVAFKFSIINQQALLGR